jgi:hypothetical protein
MNHRLTTLADAFLADIYSAGPRHCGMSYMAQLGPLVVIPEIRAV